MDHTFLHTSRDWWWSNGWNLFSWPYLILKTISMIWIVIYYPKNNKREKENTTAYGLIQNWACYINGWYCFANISRPTRYQALKTYPSSCSAFQTDSTVWILYFWGPQNLKNIIKWLMFFHISRLVMIQLLKLGPVVVFNLRNNFIGLDLGLLGRS